MQTEEDRSQRSPLASLIEALTDLDTSVQDLRKATATANLDSEKRERARVESYEKSVARFHEDANRAIGEMVTLAENTKQLQAAAGREADVTGKAARALENTATRIQLERAQERVDVLIVEGPAPRIAQRITLRVLHFVWPYAVFSYKRLATWLMVVIVGGIGGAALAFHHIVELIKALRS